MEVAAAAIGLLEASLRILRRVKKAYVGMKDAPEIFDRYCNEIGATRTVLEVVIDEKSLQTANVQAEIGKVKQIEARLRGGLTNAEKNAKAAQSKPVTAFARQLFKGSTDEKNLTKTMDELDSVKLTLCMHIQLSHVGITRDNHNDLVARLDVIESVHNTLIEVLGQSGGLRIKQLLAGRKPRGMSYLTSLSF